FREAVQPSPRLAGRTCCQNFWEGTRGDREVLTGEGSEGARSTDRAPSKYVHAPRRAGVRGEEPRLEEHPAPQQNVRVRPGLARADDETGARRQFLEPLVGDQVKPGEVAGQQAGGGRVGVVDLGGGRRALHDQLRQQPVQDLRERRHPGPEGEVDDARPVGDGHADVAHQHAVAVAEFGQGTGEMAVEDSVLFHRAATSAAVGKDTCSPCFVTVAAPTRAAYAAASARDSPAPRRQASAAVNASPAPVVSTARTATDGTRTVPSAEATSAPSPPSVTTTDRGPFASSSRAQSS